MFGNVTIGRVAGIGITVHWTFWILMAFWTLSGFASGGLTAGAMSALMLILLFGCVVLHELGHALTARSFGIGTRQITLTPLGGIAWLEGMPRHPGKELAIALAGPAVNVVLAIALTAALVLTGSVVSAEAVVDRLFGSGIWSWLLAMNVVLAVFNMLPIFPTDGGRVLRALLGLATDYTTATRWAGRIGQVAAVGLGIAALVSGQWMLAMVMGFLFLMAGQEIGRVEREDTARAGYAAWPPRAGGPVWRASTAYSPRVGPSPMGASTVPPDAPSVRGRSVIDLIPDGPGRFVVPKSGPTPGAGVRWVLTPEGWRPLST